MTDEKMFFIRNKEDLEKGDVKSRVTEYEVISDAHIVGDVTYGPYYLTIWEFSIKQEGEERKFCLRLRESIPSDPFSVGTARRSGFYHGGGIPDELVALASLFLRRRFKLGPIVREDDIPRLYGKREGWIDKPLIMGKSNLGDLSKWLEFVERLESKYHLRFILAVKLYHQALLIIEEHPDMAYLNLISAIEVLCDEANIGEVKLADLNDAELTELVASVKDEDLRSKIERAILKQYFRNYGVPNTRSTPHCGDEPEIETRRNTPVAI
ncbi:MAG: hypothetical protein EFT35_02965 [Methanophagales archaeon ANME-1-THS]|nr:MAG: hypothetical protein EFT35_02965 [Methanophagales archaeon ANME-1-THS]